MVNPIATFKRSADEWLTPRKASKLISMNLPKATFILDPIIPTASVNMLHAKSGVGKTFVALHIAMAVSSGSKFLGYKAPEPARVLYLDGELGAIGLQERLSEGLASGNYPGAEENLALLSYDLDFDGNLPNLSEARGQELIERMLKGYDVLIVDNISTFCRGGNENDAESWEAMQNWVLRLRARGITVLFVHHSAKSGQQRGTSNRETVMNTIIKLEPAGGIVKGLAVELIFEKARNLFDLTPVVARYIGGTWDFKSSKSEVDLVKSLREKGRTISEIADETGMSRSKVGRLAKD